MVTTEQTPPPRIDESKSRRESLFARQMFAPVDIAPLVFFRIAFGVLMCLEIAYALYMALQSAGKPPQLHFTYFGFSWVQAPPSIWMHLFLGVLLMSTIGVTLGLFYRVSATILALGYTWFFLIEQSDYLNHLYLVCLLGLIAIFLPTHRALSIDVLRRPEIRASLAPIWTLRLLQAQVAIVYFYGGLAKINHDWLRGEPIRTWMHTGRLAGRISDTFRNEFFVYFLSYGGLAFDLLIVPFLLWRRTRALALGLAVIFHLSNSYLFNIGIFPYLGIALTLLFVHPEWHRKILRLGVQSGKGIIFLRHAKLVSAAVCIYLTIQILLPFRHWLYPGNVHWTEEGHRFAWHMMLRNKRGQAYYIVEDRRTGKLWRIHARDHLTPRQYSKMATHPEMLLQFAHFIRDRWRHSDIAVFAVSYVSLNGRPVALLIDPKVDLSKVQYGFRAASWILPLENNHALPSEYRKAQTTGGFPEI